jgi:hypothetical protein
MNETRMMILGQALTGVALLVIAADFSAIHGGWAASLGLPFAGFAQRSFLLVPIPALLPLVLPRRIPAWLRVLCCDTLVLGLVVLPIAVFSFGSRSVTVSGQQTSALMQQLRAELRFPVVITHERGGSRIYFPRSHDPSLVREALLRHAIEPNA